LLFVEKPAKKGKFLLKINALVKFIYDKQQPRSQWKMQGPFLER